MQDQLGVPRRKLIQDVLTRWNSTYDMMDRFVVIKDALVSTLAILDTNLEQLTSHEWMVVGEAKNVLEIFKEVTDEISAEKFVSISKVILLVTAISTDLSTSAENKESLPEVKEMIAELKEGMDKRFKHIKDNDLYTQANLLDPRFKKYSFLSNAKYRRACDRLKQKAASTIIPTKGHHFKRRPRNF